MRCIGVMSASEKHKLNDLILTVNETDATDSYF